MPDPRQDDVGGRSAAEEKVSTEGIEELDLPDGASAVAKDGGMHAWVGGWVTCCCCRCVEGRWEMRLREETVA